MRKRKPRNIHDDIATPRDIEAIDRARRYTSQWTMNGRPILLAWYQGKQLTAYCPLCGELHNHAPYSGHRCSHCETITENRNGGYYLLLLPGSVPDDVLEAATAAGRVRKRYYKRRHDNRYFPEKFSISKVLRHTGLMSI